VLLEADERVERHAKDRVRVRLRGLLDLDAALRAGDHRDRPGRAVEDESEVILLRDVRRRGDEHGLHRDALDVEADDLARPLLRLVRRGGELHAAGLAAAAHQDLGLHDHRAADALRRGASILGRRCRDARPDRDAMAGKDLLRSVLLELHAGASPLR